MLQRKTKDLGKLDRDELLALARRVSDTPVSRRASASDLLEVVGQSLSLEEIKRETRGIMAQRSRRKKMGRRYGSRRSLTGLIVLAIVVSSFYVISLASAPPQYYLFHTWERSSGRGEPPTSSLAAVDADGNLFVTREWPNNSLCKFGPTGVEEWRKNFTVEEGLRASVLSIAVDADTRHIYLAGVTVNLIGFAENGVLMKFDPFGEVEWIRIWGFKSVAKSVAAANGSAYVTGSTTAYGGTRVILIKYDSEGSELWNTTWSRNQPSSASAIGSDVEGNVFLAGYFNSSQVPSETVWRSFLVKYDSGGNEAWNATWGSEEGAEGKSVKVEGGYVYALDTVGGLRKHGVESGALIWRKPLGWARTGYYGGASITEGFYVDTFSIGGDGDINAGGAYRRTEDRGGSETIIHSVCVTIFDSDGKKTMNLTSPYRDGYLHIDTIVLHHDGSVYVVGWIYYPETSEWELVLMKLDVMSSSLVGTALAVGLASVASITLAVLWKEKRTIFETTGEQ